MESLGRRTRNRIREIRGEESQSAFAERVGQPLSTIARLDQNPFALPSIETATKLARALGCELTDLFV